MGPYDFDGWFKIYRSIKYTWIWDNSLYTKWWVDLNSLAYYENTRCTMGNKVIGLKKGQAVCSIRFLCNRWVETDSYGRKRKPSKDKVSRFLKMLEEDGMIIRSNDLPRGTTLITICPPPVKKEAKMIKYRRVSDIKPRKVKDFKNSSKPCGCDDAGVMQESRKAEKMDNVCLSNASDYAHSESQSNLNGVALPVPLDVSSTNAFTDGDDEHWLGIFLDRRHLCYINDLLPSFALHNPNFKGIDDFKRMCNEVITQWKLSKVTHSDYTSWANHLISQIRIKNDREGLLSAKYKLYKNGKKGGSSDRELVKDNLDTEFFNAVNRLMLGDEFNNL